MGYESAEAILLWLLMAHVLLVSYSALTLVIVFPGYLSISGACTQCKNNALTSMPSAFPVISHNTMCMLTLRSSHTVDGFGNGCEAGR